MSLAVTLSSDSQDGLHHKLTLEQTLKDKGFIRDQVWNINQNYEIDTPNKDDIVKLYDIRSDKNKQIICRGDISGPDPLITCFLNDGQQHTKSSIRIVISGSFLGLGDGTTDYPIDEREYDKLKSFLAAADFPVIA